MSTSDLTPSTVDPNTPKETHHHTHSPFSFLHKSHAPHVKKDHIDASNPATPSQNPTSDPGIWPSEVDNADNTVWPTETPIDANRDILPGETVKQANEEVLPDLDSGKAKLQKVFPENAAAEQVFPPEIPREF